MKVKTNDKLEFVIAPRDSNEYPWAVTLLVNGRIFSDKMAGGLTALKPGKGQWVSSNKTLSCERMIPVRIMATADEMLAIAKFTINHYNQEAVMFYKIAEECHIIGRSSLEQSRRN